MRRCCAFATTVWESPGNCCRTYSTCSCRRSSRSTERKGARHWARAGAVASHDTPKGRVEARSTPGEGSELVVSLPVLASAPESAVVTEIAPAPAHGLKVLVAEDNVDVAHGVQRLLRVSGHDTLVVNDGASAMKVAREFVPDVVILDIGLPIIDGFQVAKWIRQKPALREGGFGRADGIRAGL